jgi:AcrR family transcriptional regulator
MSQLHPTKEALIASALHLMETTSSSDMTSELVLEHSGVSRGSLYHHFEDFSALIEAAQVRRFTNHVDRSIEVLWNTLQTSKTREEMMEKLKEVTRITQSEAMASSRIFRISAIAATANNSRMQKLFGAEQERLTESIADLYREVLNRGWGNSHLDPRSVAVLIQAYTLGKVIEDFTPNRMDPAHWETLIDSILEFILFSK